MARNDHGTKSSNGGHTKNSGGSVKPPVMPWKGGKKC
jgi:hypothetical protein